MSERWNLAKGTPEDVEISCKGDRARITMASAKRLEIVVDSTQIVTLMEKDKYFFHANSSNYWGNDGHFAISSNLEVGGAATLDGALTLTTLGGLVSLGATDGSGYKALRVPSGS